MHDLLAAEIAGLAEAEEFGRTSEWLDHGLGLVARFQGPEAPDIRRAVAGIADLQLTRWDHERAALVGDAAGPSGAPLATVRTIREKADVLLSLLRAVADVEAFTWQ